MPNFLQPELGTCLVPVIPPMIISEFNNYYSYPINQRNAIKELYPFRYHFNSMGS